MHPSNRSTIVAWAAVLVGTALATVVFDQLALPSPPLFGALFAGMAWAIIGRGASIQLPRLGSTVGQALVGVSMGVLLNPATLRQLGDNAGSIAAVNIGTLVLSLMVGRLFASWGRVSAATGAFSMIAGGAAGITAIARELGADDRVTSVVQYLRVVLILVGMPLVTAGVFHPASMSVAPTVDGSNPLWLDLLFVAGSAAIGVFAARVIRFPSGSLLGPLFVAAALSISGWIGSPSAPEVVVAVGYALVGLQVGLRFTRSSLREVGRLLPLAIALIVAIVLGCAGFAVVLARVADVPLLDAYLATTPGGLYAVLATAASSGADVTFVLAVQVVRLLLVLASAPLVASWFRSHEGSWADDVD